MSDNFPAAIHVPVLLAAVKEFLLPALQQPSDCLVDCTLGGGGHLAALLESSAACFLALDKDQRAVAAAQKKFSSEIAAGRLQLRHLDFADFFRTLGEEEKFSAILADLGFSSDQLEDGQRGLSFQQEGPLDMRLDPSQGLTAYELLSSTHMDELTRVLRQWGEERMSGRIAREICEAMDDNRLPNSTTALAELVARAVPRNYRYGRIHPATRTFQALRIWVNGELAALDSLLERAILALRPGGRLAVISFHSLEDRRVKHSFRRLKGSGYRLVTPRPLVADESEVVANPRSRSAKMRVIEKI